MRRLIWFCSGVAIIILASVFVLQKGFCEKETTEDKNQVTIKTVSMFGGTDPASEVYQEISHEFMELYPNVIIEDNSSVSDEYWKSAVALDFSIGNEPDVLQYFTDAIADSLVRTGKLVSIEEIKSEYPEYAIDTYDWALEACANTDGVMRAVPTLGYWEGLYCNKDLFEKYDVKLPTDWSSFFTAIKKFNKNGIIPIACSLNEVPHYWIEFLMLYKEGEEGFEIIPEEVPSGWEKGLLTFKTLRDLEAFPKNTDTISDTYACELFRSKRAAMMLNGSWIAGTMTKPDTIEVIPFPGVQWQKAAPGTMVAGMSSGFYITRAAWEDPEKREAAVRFVMAQTNKEAVQKYWEKGGCVAQTATKVEDTRQMTLMSNSIKEYVNSGAKQVSPTDSRMGEAYTILVSSIVDISKGEVSPREVLEKMLSEKRRNTGRE